MRKAYIDWLRNLGILYLFPFHTARIFDTIEPNYVKGAPDAWFSDNLIYASSWFMPLLFLLAGMSSFYALERRTPKEYMRERVLRLLIPFVCGILLIVPPQGYYAAKFHYGYEGGYLRFLREYFTDFSDLSGYFGTFTPGHLWFILFLFVISAALLPLMKKLQESGLKPAALRHPALILLPSAGICLLSAAPDIGGKNILEYAAYMLLGFLIASDEGISDMLERYRRAYLTIALAGTGALLIEIHTIGWQEGWHPLGITSSLGYYLTTLAALLAMLGYARRHLNRPSELLSRLSAAAFPVYILHQTVLIALGYYVLPYFTGVAAPFILIMLESLAATIALYALFVHIKPLRFILGIKVPRA